MDKREEILVRLFAIVDSITDAETRVRNRDQLETDQLPALYLFDGDEESDSRGSGRGRLGASPNLVTMTPELCIALKPGPGLQTPGTDLNGWRVKIVKLVTLDATLQALAGPNGEVFYRGLVTDLGKDRAMQGQMLLQFGIRYVLRPSGL